MPRYIDTYTYILGTRQKHKTSAQAVAPSRSTLSGLLISWRTCHCPHTKTTTAPLGGEQSSVWKNQSYIPQISKRWYMVCNACMSWRYRVKCPSTEHMSESIESLSNQCSSWHTGRYGNTHMIASTKRHQSHISYPIIWGHNCLCFTGHIIPA